MNNEAMNEAIGEKLDEKLFSNEMSGAVGAAIADYMNNEPDKARELAAYIVDAIEYKGKNPAEVFVDESDFTKFLRVSGQRVMGELYPEARLEDGSYNPAYVKLSSFIRAVKMQFICITGAWGRSPIEWEGDPEAFMKLRGKTDTGKRNVLKFAKSLLVLAETAVDEIEDRERAAAEAVKTAAEKAKAEAAAAMRAGLDENALQIIEMLRAGKLNAGEIMKSVGK